MKEINVELLNQTNRSMKRLNEFINKDAPKQIIKTEIGLLKEKLDKLLEEIKD